MPEEFESDIDFDCSGESDCCGARIIMGDICSECGEHCENVDGDAE